MYLPQSMERAAISFHLDSSTLFLLSCLLECFSFQKAPVGCSIKASMSKLRRWSGLPIKYGKNIQEIWYSRPLSCVVGYSGNRICQSWANLFLDLIGRICDENAWPLWSVGLWHLWCGISQRHDAMDRCFFMLSNSAGSAEGHNPSQKNLRVSVLGCTGCSP